MEEYYFNGECIEETTELEKQKDLIKNIIKTSKELRLNNKNFEMAEQGLVDYYIYQIKANQAKLDFLIKTAKSIGITINKINEFEYEINKNKTG